MAINIEVPDFNYSGYYYPQLLESLITYMRTNAPEITDENPHEPFIQLLRAFALVGHYSSVLMDVIANENYIATAKFLDSLQAHAQLVDFQLRQAVPAQAELVAPLTKVFSTDTDLILPGSLFETEPIENEDPISFELIDGYTLKATNRVERVYAKEGVVWSSDFSTQANTGSSPFTPWSSPAPGDELYIGHSTCLWGQLDIVLTTPAADINGVWEYYDGVWRDMHPSSVINNGPYLTIDLTSLLGTDNRAGTTVRIELVETEDYEELSSQWVGGKNIAYTTGVLGQIAPSIDPNDYLVGTPWNELPDIADGSSDFTLDGSVTYTFPKTLNDDWVKATIQNFTGYWLRYRIISVGGGPTSPSIDRLRIDQGDQYIAFDVAQGEPAEDVPLGSSDGSANQSFNLGQYPLVEGGLIVEVDEGAGFEEWTQVTSFINSTAATKDFRLDVAADDIATIIFGDGTYGKIPATGTNNIRAYYRINAVDDGNVGSNRITRNKTGVAYLSEVYNPFPASGWRAKDGADEEALNNLRREIPASLRALGRAVSVYDVEHLAQRWTTDDGAMPIYRAHCIEEGYGAKTIEIIVVGANGAALPGSVLEALELYFNGNQDEFVYGVLIINHEAYATNYTPKIINIEVEVTGGTQTAVETALAALLTPLALDADGDWRWRLGGVVPRSLIVSAIHEDQRVTNVNLIQPATDVLLGARELPALGTVTITML